MHISMLQVQCFQTYYCIDALFSIISVLYRDLNSTVAWLAQETASRFHRLTGLQCVLSIMLGDGSVPSPDDSVTLLLSSNEEVL